MTPFTFLAQVLAVEGVPNWIGELAFGSVVVLALAGWIWFKPAVDSLHERMTKAEAQRDALIEVYQDEIIPVLREAQGGVTRVAAIAEEVVPVLREVKVLLLQRPSPDRET